MEPDLPRSWWDDRPRYWGSRPMWANVAVACGYAGLVYVFLYRGTKHGPGWPGPVLFSLLVPLATGTISLAAFGAARGVRRALARDPLLATVVAQHGGVLALAPQEAFDAVVRALGAVPRASLDCGQTSIVRGTLRATTPWRWLSSNGERIDVQLFEIDAEHVAVFAGSYPAYQGGLLRDAKSLAERNVVRFFAALPIERP